MTRCRCACVDLDTQKRRYNPTVRRQVRAIQNERHVVDGEINRGVKGGTSYPPWAGQERFEKGPKQGLVRENREGIWLPRSGLVQRPLCTIGKETHSPWVSDATKKVMRKIINSYSGCPRVATINDVLPAILSDVARSPGGRNQTEIVP